MLWQCIWHGEGWDTGNFSLSPKIAFLFHKIAVPFFFLKYHFGNTIFVISHLGINENKRLIRKLRHDWGNSGITQHCKQASLYNAHKEYEVPRRVLEGLCHHVSDTKRLPTSNCWVWHSQKWTWVLRFSWCELIGRSNICGEHIAYVLFHCVVNNPSECPEIEIVFHHSQVMWLLVTAWQNPTPKAGNIQ